MTMIDFDYNRFILIVEKWEGCEALKICNASGPSKAKSFAVRNSANETHIKIFKNKGKIVDSRIICYGLLID